MVVDWFKGIFHVEDDEKNMDWESYDNEEEIFDGENWQDDYPAWKIEEDFNYEPEK